MAFDSRLLSPSRSVAGEMHVGAAGRGFNNAGECDTGNVLVDEHVWRVPPTPL